MTSTLEVEDANVPQLAKIPDEANSVLSSYFVGGQSIVSRESEVQVLSNIVVEYTCTQKVSSNGKNRVSKDWRGGP